MSYKDFFKDKKITVMGLGLLGRSLGDIKFLLECGAHLTVTDKKTEEELKTSLDELKRLPNFESINFNFGGHKLEDFKNCDMVIKSAGVLLDSPFIEEARKNNVPVYMSTALFAKFASEMGAVIVGVTGTRGKSTVTHMIFHTLEIAGRPAHLGGNIRGKSTLALLPEIQKGDICVLELDSWQLQGFGDLKISPNISVFTNLKNDHLNYYPSLESYFSDKANIFKFQKEGDVLISGKKVTEEWIDSSNPPVKPEVPALENFKLKILGEHNKENASLGASALRALKIPEEQIKAGLESFEAVEGRLQLLKEISGIKIYNDNNSTTPDATVAALSALVPQKPVLILGGADKNLPLDILIDKILDFTSAIVLIPGTGTDKLLPILKPLLERKEIPYLTADSISDAVKDAFTLAKNRNTKIILFSPAFASFGMFKNEYDRGEKFIEAVNDL